MARAGAPRKHREPLLMATTLVTATLRVALPVRLTGHAREGGGGRRPAFEGQWWRRGQGGSGGQSTRARRRTSRYTGGVPVGRGARGRQEGENQRERGRGRGGSRRRLTLRHAGGKHVIGGAQAVVGERGREGGAPPQAAPVLERARGSQRPRARCTRGRGRAQSAAGPKHTRCL